MTLFHRAFGLAKTIFFTPIIVVLSSLFIVPSLQSQNDLRDLDVTVLRYPSPGYYFVAAGSASSSSALDNAGKNMFIKSLGKALFVNNVQTYGNKWFTHFALPDNVPVFLRRDVHNTVIDTLRPSGGYATDFHECRIISDTSYLILGVEKLTVDLSATVPGGKSNADVSVAIVQERTFSGQTLFQWRSIDYIPVADAVEDIDLTAASIDYIHVNSIVKDKDGNYLLSCRHLDEVIKINGRNGSVIWRLGGSKSKHNQFTFENDTTDGFVGFSHQHSAIISKTGTLLMFDNGNLKPGTPRSRAVEYSIDEVRKTVRRVWEFSPTPDVYASSMGSVQELENGNILVGYGSATTNLVAQEVNRDGTIHVQIQDPTGDALTAYRVTKSSMHMSGMFREVSTTGAMSFADAASSTNLKVNWNRVSAATSAMAERHAYQPHNISFTEDVACGVLPSRWVFRVKDPSLVSGTMTFDLGAEPAIDFPDKVNLYYRSAEGVGDFQLVAAKYDQATKLLTVDKLMYGEFMLAYAMCIAPTLVSPANLATEVGSTQKLEWTEAVYTGEYQVALSESPTFATTFALLTVVGLKTTMPSVLEFTTFYWRVRSKVLNGYGPWSEVFQFTTQIAVPTIIGPRVSGVDTVAVLPTQAFSWHPVKGARTYHVTVNRFGLPVSVADTLIQTTSFVLGTTLQPNTKYTWNVRALSDAVVGRQSADVFFVTAPATPQLITPANKAIDVPTDSPLFVWDEVPGAVRYILTCRRTADNVVLANVSSERPPLTIPTLPLATQCLWTCRAVSKYGSGIDAKPLSFTTTSTTILNSPGTLSPKKAGDVDTLSVPFSWTNVPLARFYDLQITSKLTFEQFDIDTSGLTSVEWIAPILKPGITYRWRVIGYNGTAAGRWSDTATFTTVAAPSQGLTPVSPVSGSAEVAVSGNFTYTTSSRFTSYGVQVGLDAALSSPTFQLFSDNALCPYTGLSTGTTYFWRAVGIKAGQPDEYGSTSSFRTITFTGVEATNNLDDIQPSAHFDGDVLTFVRGTTGAQITSGSLYSLQGNIVKVIDKDAWLSGSSQCTGLAHGSYFLVLSSSTGDVVVVPLLKI
ncbi:MAG: aryl-sulfate sulfotransferase [Candidatus Kapabacteria bacterium]|nr:aryl-sulfate sulfotransferase [Candidatus Kapabacteria bacterium]